MHRYCENACITVCRTLAIIFVSYVSITQVNEVIAGAGDLDLSFGSDGKVITEISDNSERASGVAIQRDGKIVTAGAGSGDLIAVRYNVDGAIDVTFGMGGIAYADIGGYHGDEAFDVAIQPDGKVITAGFGGYGQDFALARFNSDGSLDLDFGDGGTVTTDFEGDSWDEAHAVTLQSDGKIVATGYTDNPGIGLFGFATARYLANGDLDPTFGVEGKVTTSINWFDSAEGVSIQPDGKIVVAGWSGLPQDFVLVRYNIDGSLDSKFGIDGKVTTDFGSSDIAHDIAIQEDGKIIVVGTGQGRMALARYLPDGSLDHEFDEDGKVITEITGENIETAYGVAIQGDNKIVIAGVAFLENQERFAIARYNTDGSLDSSFGLDGKVLTDFVDPAEVWSVDRAWDVAIQPDGKILAVGGAGPGMPSPYHALARYQGDGSGSAHTMDGIGAPPGTFKEKLKVKGCGSQRSLGEITGFTMGYDGTWSLTTTGGAFTGTYSDIKPNKKFSLTLGPSSYDELITGIETGSDALCDLAPGTSALTDITIKQFTAKLNKKWTAISINLAIAAVRQDATSSNKISYRAKGKIAFVPSGCSGETVGSLRGSDALVYCGNPNAAVISVDNALELLANVIGSGSTGPALSTASVQPQMANLAVTEGIGTSAQRLAGQLFDPGLYADANPTSPSLATQADAGLLVQTASISINESEPCDNIGGSLSLKGKLSNQGIGSLDMVFHDCLLEGDVFNGSATMTIDAFDLGYLTFTDAVLDFTMLSSSGVSGDTILSGTMRYQLDMIADTETLTLDLVMRDNTTDRAYWAKGLVITTVYDNWQFPNSYNMAINGRLYDSTHGYVDAVTLQPLAYSSLYQPYPDQGGNLSLTGANDASILFTVLSTTTANLAVDIDGDGMAEYENTINTSVINDDPGTPAAPVAADVGDQSAGTSAAILLDAIGSFCCKYDTPSNTGNGNYWSKV